MFISATATPRFIAITRNTIPTRATYSSAETSGFTGTTGFSTPNGRFTIWKRRSSIWPRSRARRCPFRFGGLSLSTLGPNAYLVKDGLFTTSDSSRPDYSIRAKTVRIYPKDRIIFSNVMLYIGRVPVFWYPYLYQSLNQDTSFTFTPGYGSIYGAYLLTQYSFPLTDQIAGRARLDLYSTRGVGIGLEGAWGRFKRSAAPVAGSVAEATAAAPAAAVEESRGTQNFGRFMAYYIDDLKPGTNNTGSRPRPNPTESLPHLPPGPHVSGDGYLLDDQYQ